MDGKECNKIRLPGKISNRGRILVNVSIMTRARRMSFLYISTERKIVEVYRLPQPTFSG